MTTWQLHKEAHSGGPALNCWYCDNIVPPISGTYLATMPKGERGHMRGLLNHTEKKSLQRTNFDFYREIMANKEKAHKIRSEAEKAAKKIAARKREEAKT